MSQVPYFFKSPDDAKLRAILAFYKAGKLHSALTANRVQCETWSDEVAETLSPAKAIAT